MSNLICAAASWFGAELDHCQPTTDRANGGKPEQTVARNEDPQARSFLEELLFGTSTGGGAVGCTKQKAEPPRETNEAVPPPRKDQPKAEEDKGQRQPGDQLPQLERGKPAEDIPRQAEGCSREALEANSKGMDSLRKGLVVSAKSWFERAIAVDGNCVPAHVNLAAIYFNEQDYLKAKSHSEKALKVDPNQPKALYLLAGTLYAMGVFDADPKPRLREAKVYIEKAARLNPNQPDIL